MGMGLDIAFELVKMCLKVSVYIGKLNEIA